MLIRSFEEHDRLPLRDLYLQTRLHAWTWLDSSAWRPEDFDSVTKDEQIWVAEDEGELLGFASVWVVDDFLHSLYVAPAHQGKRVGKALLEKVQAEFVAHGTLKCLVKNVSAFEFYQRHGWLVESRGDSEDGEYYLMGFGGNSPSP